MTFPVASAIIIKHSANVYRGIAQLVEQRSPKPRAVSSKLTTPAMTHRFFGTCAFCFLNPLRRSRARFPLLSPAVTSSPGAGEVGPQGDALWHCQKLYRHRQKPSPWGRWLRPKGADGRGLYPLLQKIAFSANLCLTTGRLFDIIEHVPAVRRRTNLSDHGPVAQLVRAPACHAGGRRFEPDPGRHLLL